MCREKKTSSRQWHVAHLKGLLHKLPATNKFLEDKFAIGKVHLSNLSSPWHMSAFSPSPMPQRSTISNLTRSSSSCFFPICSWTVWHMAKDVSSSWLDIGLWGYWTDGFLMTQLHRPHHLSPVCNQERCNEPHLFVMSRHVRKGADQKLPFSLVFDSCSYNDFHKNLFLKTVWKQKQRI